VRSINCRSRRISADPAVASTSDALRANSCTPCKSCLRLRHSRVVGLIM
jgi:hypothetical protein